jgi:UDP-N-acetyl-2-amino-2-deoxyglucuronate dehydrogenase
MEAIRDIGGILVACHDITDSVGILDTYFPDARFFTDAVEFEDFLGQERNRPDYFVVCTPNDLHVVHAALGLRIGADVILEKPPALSSRELDALTTLRAGHGLLHRHRDDQHPLGHDAALARPRRLRPRTRAGPRPASAP